MPPKAAKAAKAAAASKVDVAAEKIPAPPAPPGEEMGDSDTTDDSDQEDPNNFEAPQIDVEVATDRRLAPVDDDTYAMMRKRQIGAAVMFVPDLNPKWRKGPVTQRPLGTGHVKDLESRLKHKIRRTELPDRLRVSCTRAEYEQCIRYTCGLYQDWHQAKLCPKAYTPVELRTALKDLIMNPLPISKAPLLVWDPALQEKPQLDAGMHRREAFLHAFNADGKITELTPQTAHILGWVVDIADMDQLDDKYYRLIRANQHDVYAPDSQGDIFMQLDSIFDAFTAKEDSFRGKGHGNRQARFEAYVEAELNRVIPEPKRFLQLLSNDVWRAQAARYVSYAFGRQAFRVYHFTVAAGQFMDEFWIGHLDTQYNKMTKALGDSCKKKFRIEDLQAVRVVGIPNQALADVRVLFFPVAADYGKGALAVDPRWFIDAEFTRLKFASPFQDGNSQQYTMRRPGFLENLTDDEYCSVYGKLTGVSFMVPDPQALIKEIKIVAQYLTNIVEHVIFWTDQNWARPANNQSTMRANLSFVRALQSRYKPVADDDDMSMLTIEEIEIQANEIKKAERSVIQALGHIQTYIHRNIKEWKSIPKTKLMLPKAYVGTALSKDQRTHYRDMFAYQPWSGLLTLVIHDLGSSRFTGVMKPWVHHPKLHDMRSSVAPISDQIRSFYKGPGLIRMKFLNLNDAPYHHNDRVAAAVEQAILVEETRTLGMVAKDTRIVKKRMAKAESIAGPDVKVDWHDLSDDEDLSQGTGIVEIGHSLEELSTIVPKLIRDEALLLKDFDIKFSALELDSDKLLSKLPKAPVLCPKQKVGAVDSGSDYEAPPATASRSSGSRKRTGLKGCDEGTPSKKSKVGRPVSSRTRKA